MSEDGLVVEILYKGLFHQACFSQLLTLTVAIVLVTAIRERVSGGNPLLDRELLRTLVLLFIGDIYIQ